MARSKNLTLDEMAAACNVAPLTILQWIESKELPYTCPRSRLSFKPKEVLKWAKEHGVQIALGIEREADLSRPQASEP